MRIIAFVLLFVVLFPIMGYADNSRETKFIVLGHVYPDYEALNLSVTLINDANPDFVVFLGDNVYNVPERNWSEFSSIIDRIKVPVYLLAGNHDIDINPGDKEYFEENIGSLFQEFEINGNRFIILNSILKKDYYDISEEQIDFIKAEYENGSENTIVFMHHCLFYQDNNKFCNARPDYVSENSNWNSKVVPIIKDKTIGVFVGDVGYNEPYFSYNEENVSYFGVGFSVDKIKFPQHFLEVTINNNVLKVTPVPIRQDLAKIDYGTEKSENLGVRAFIRDNLKLIFFMISFVITLLLIIILFFLIKKIKGKI